MTTPLAYYLEQCQNNVIIKDPQQWSALQPLEQTYQALCQEQQKRSGLFSPLRKPRAVPGNYVWGGVGVGKTFLMDCFYTCLPFKQKKRLHFHQFMRFLHQELKRYSGRADPLQGIAEALAQETLVLCFDELVVSDITDAMLLGRLLEKLFAQGLCLVATSNLSPDDLYKNGVQRQHFLPTIALLKKQLSMVHLPLAQDYRLRHLKQAGVFHVPPDARAEMLMEKSFSLLAGDSPSSEAALELYGRTIPIKKAAGAVIWFDFKALCTAPRSQQDYLAIAEKYTTVFVSNIPRLAPEAKAKVSLFIRLIDILYDARVRLVLSAESSVDNIYSQGQMLFEYTRACSRLHEMQSERYFSRGLEPS